MPSVIHVRDVPDDVHEALTNAARDEGLSLSTYVRRELGQIAGRAQRVRDNAAVVRRTQAEVGGGIDADTIRELLDEGRRR